MQGGFLYLQQILQDKKKRISFVFSNWRCLYSVPPLTLAMYIQVSKINQFKNNSGVDNH